MESSKKPSTACQQGWFLTNLTLRSGMIPFPSNLHRDVQKPKLFSCEGLELLVPSCRRSSHRDRTHSLRIATARIIACKDFIAQPSSGWCYQHTITINRHPPCHCINNKLYRYDNPREVNRDEVFGKAAFDSPLFELLLLDEMANISTKPCPAHIYMVTIGRFLRLICVS